MYGNRTAMVPKSFGEDFEIKLLYSRLGHRSYHRMNATGDITVLLERAAEGDDHARAVLIRRGAGDLERVAVREWRFSRNRFRTRLEAG
jgi:hypothetical protein